MIYPSQSSMLVYTFETLLYFTLGMDHELSTLLCLHPTSSSPYLIHVCMEEVVLGFWKGWLRGMQSHFLLRVARGTISASLWLKQVVDAFVRS